jgi:catechol 2,3-dioxygenase-like lactoylglutathione lyase family enzyme
MSDSTESDVSPARIRLGGAVPIFRVEDLDRSVAYYVDRLGFELQWRGDPLASVGRDRTSIMLSEGDQGHSGTWVWIAAGDVDALYAELEARGGVRPIDPIAFAAAGAALLAIGLLAAFVPARRAGMTDPAIASSDAARSRGRGTVGRVRGADPGRGAAHRR